MYSVKSEFLDLPQSCFVFTCETISSTLYYSMQFYRTIALTAGAPFVWLFWKITQITFAYQWRKRGLKDLPRQKTFMGSLDRNDWKGLMNMLEEFKDENGNIMPLVNQGPSFTGEPCVAVCDPDLFREILLNSRDFIKNPVSSEIFLGEGLAMGEGLATSSLIAKGELWRTHRKLITPLFHFQSLKSAATVVVEETKLFIERDIIGATSAIDGANFFQKITARVIVKFAFGASLDADWMISTWQKFISYIIKFFLTRLFIGNLPFPWMRKRENLLNQMKQRIHSLISKKSEEGESEAHNLISLLLQAKEPVSEKHIMDHCMTFLAGGIDTSSKLLGWMFYFLGIHPDIQAKLHMEVDEVLQGREPTPEDVSKLSYCKCVILETLRMRSPLTVIDRLTATDVILAGKRIPKGTPLLLWLHTAHFSPKYWKDPHVFLPERFEKVKDQEAPHTNHPFSFLPFGAGERNCIGQKFAIVEVTIILSMLMQKFTIRSSSPKEGNFFTNVTGPDSYKLEFLPR